MHCTPKTSWPKSVSTMPGSALTSSAPEHSATVVGNTSFAHAIGDGKPVILTSRAAIRSRSA